MDAAPRFSPDQAAARGAVAAALSGAGIDIDAGRTAALDEDARATWR